MDWGSIGASAFTAVCALIGVIWSNRRTEALMVYRIQELERKVDKHNQLVDRMYKAEERIRVLETKEGAQK